MGFVVVESRSTANVCTAHDREKERYSENRCDQTNRRNELIQCIQTLSIKNLVWNSAKLRPHDSFTLDQTHRYLFIVTATFIFCVSMSGQNITVNRKRRTSWKPRFVFNFCHFFSLSIHHCMIALCVFFQRILLEKINSNCKFFVWIFVLRIL